MFSYRAIIKQSWKVTKNHKKLWIFGFFAFILSVGGEQQIADRLFSGNYGMSSVGDLTYSYIAILQKVKYLFSLDTNLGFLATFLVILLTSLILLVLWLCLRSQVALISWTKKVKTEKSIEKVSFWGAIMTNNKDAFRILGLDILFKFAIAVLFMVLSLPLVFIMIQDSNLAIFFYTLFFIFFIPASLALSLIIKYSMVAVVIEKKTLIKSIEDGFKTFTDNWLVSLEMGILLLLINFVIGYIAYVIFLSVYPIIQMTAFAGMIVHFSILISTLFVALIMTVSALATFQTAAWTNLFLDLKKSPAKAKLERIFKKKKK